MKTGERVLLFFILPVVAPLLYPPALLLGGLPIVAVAALIIVLIGVFLWQGRGLALTLSIFLQGFNVIVRIMMLLSNAVPAPAASGGPLQADIPYIVAAVLSIGLSLWLLLRLDRPVVHAAMVS